MGMVFVGNGYGFLRNLRYTYYPQVSLPFQAKKKYIIILLINYNYKGEFNKRRKEKENIYIAHR